MSYDLMVRSLGSIIGSAAALMDGGAAFSVKDTAVIDLGIDQPVVTALHALAHLGV